MFFQLLKCADWTGYLEARYRDALDIIVESMEGIAATLLRPEMPALVFLLDNEMSLGIAHELLCRALDGEVRHNWKLLRTSNMIHLPS